MRWLIRMKRWAENPPSPKMVAMVLGIIAVCLALWGIEQVVGWPEALTPHRTGLSGLH